MARTTGKSGFKLRSGNKPSFTKMRTFGIGPGTSPYKQDNVQKIESNPGDPYTYEKRGDDFYYKGPKDDDFVLAKGEGLQAIKDDYGNQVDQPNKEEVEGKEVNDLMDTSADDASKKLKKAKKMRGLGKIAKNIGMIGVSALTGGLDEVYGTGKIQYGAGSVIKGDPKDKETKLSADDVQKMIDKQMGK